MPPQLECRQVDGMEAEKAEAKKKHGYIPTSLYIGTYMLHIYIYTYNVYICLHSVKPVDSRRWVVGTMSVQCLYFSRSPGN